MMEPRLLDLFCGAGGCSVGYSRAGFDVVGVDDFSNSSPEVLNRLQRLGGSKPVFERANVCDLSAMSALLARHKVDAVVHFAAFKAVGESAALPLAYYGNNVGGLVSTGDAGHRLQAHGVLQQCDGLWRPAAAADQRAQPAVGHQPLRPDQTDRRGLAARPRCGRCGPHLTAESV